MKFFPRFALAFLLSLAPFATARETSGFRPIFNGKDLTGWDGNPELWKVEDGCIVGSTTGPEQLPYNQFLVWRGGTLKNFELRVKIRLTNGNTGIQYRSRELKDNGPWSIGGYQCDLVANPNYVGMCFEERGRGMMVFNGQRGLIDDKGAAWLLGTLPNPPAKTAEWNEFTVIARGNQLTHRVNGVTVMEAVDHQEAKRALEGLLAFQLHRGPAMKVEFKDILLKELPEGGVLTLQASPIPEGATRIEKPKAPAKPVPPAKATPTPPAAPPAVGAIQTLPGFRVDLIYSVPKEEQGSWVALTVDPQGSLIASDQYGGLYRLTPPPIDGTAAPRVEKLDAQISGAHGLLYAFDSLYVMVNEQPETSGLWRLRDTKGTGQFDEKTLLRELKGRGEHGVHGLVLAPDGRSIYVACGNATNAPDPLEHVRLSQPVGDDQVVPRLGRGGAFTIARPQGYTAKVSPDGQRFEMISAGLRNHYDLAFNALGDLFTYDSDMEWDVGTPWYRPTRICQLVSGGDFGFRENSGKLPAYYADTVPPIIEVGPGSPTGLTSGLGTKFPAKYQHAIYAADWTYGTLYAVHLTPEASSYRAELEEFIIGKPLPFTDLVVGRDGALYFATGGRKAQSEVYRVTYTGAESTAPAPAPLEKPEHRLRAELERLHDQGTGPEAIEKAWPHLGHPDRFVRWAARVAIERQPVQLWAARAAREAGGWGALEAAIALARMGGKDAQPALFERLSALDFASLDVAQQFALIRACQISIARAGAPEGDVRARTVARLDAVYPARSNDLNRELSRTLIALDVPSAVPKTVRLLTLAHDDEPRAISAQRLARNTTYAARFSLPAPNRPNLQQLALAYALRTAKAGWTPELHKTFFEWFPRTARWQGGNGFRGNVDQIRADALANVADEAERKTLDALSRYEIPVTTQVMKPPKGPGGNYTVEEVVALAKDGLRKRSFTRGRELFAAAACQTCHKFGNAGGGIGPDLTGSGSRYTVRDLIENIVDPSKVISDQYESTILVKRDGSALTGRITSEEAGTLFVAANPFAPGELTEVKTGELQSRQPSPASLMPPALINSMNPKEVLDLLAYLLSGGDAQHSMFR